jgi:ribosomal protein S18 acetylase RimI-like enzyme
MIGIEAANKHGVIHHIVVSPLWRRSSIGRLMIDQADHAQSGPNTKCY